MIRFRLQVALCLGAVAIPGTLLAQGQPAAVAATRADAAALRAVDTLVDQMTRSGELRVREVVRDSLLPDRQHERLDQYLNGVRIVGGDLTRQTAADGTVSIFGKLHDAAIDTNPVLSADEAQSAIDRAVSGTALDGAPELVVLPLSDGYHLAYLGRAMVGLGPAVLLIDAASGALLQQYSEFLNDVGSGTGAYGDVKKMSDTLAGGVFAADDKLRPAEITTYDMKGSLARTSLLFAAAQLPTAGDIASSATNTWTDSTVVDAHVYAGRYYDYLFKQFGRHGIDDRDLRIALFTHPVSLANIGSASPSVIDTYYINAEYCGSCGPNGRGAVEFGEGAPRGFLGPGVEVKPFSAAFDVVAHELTHAVTGSTARLNGFPFSEAGALNEGFSDIFGVSTAFFYEPPGNSPLQASYLQGRDLTVPAGLLGRSLSNPRSTGDPDHYTLRIIGGDPHYNSTIASHAFYLAIEGGINQTSGLSVEGVGAANRDQIEKAFFRALTVLMPSSSTFALTRDATIQAARDLYGSGSAAERAITQAWDAVGVEDRIGPTATLVPNPAFADTTGSCLNVGLRQPTWVIGGTVSAGANTLTITEWDFDFYDHTGALQDRQVFSGADFARQFNYCGPGSSRILAQTDACFVTCVDVRGDASGATQITFSALDSSGGIVTFSTPRISLR